MQITFKHLTFPTIIHYNNLGDLNGIFNDKINLPRGKGVRGRA